MLILGNGDKIESWGTCVIFDPGGWQGALTDPRREPSIRATNFGWSKQMDLRHVRTWGICLRNYYGFGSTLAAATNIDKLPKYQVFKSRHDSPQSCEHRQQYFYGVFFFLMEMMMSLW